MATKRTSEGLCFFVSPSIKNLYLPPILVHKLFICYLLRLYYTLSTILVKKHGYWLESCCHLASSHIFIAGFVCGWDSNSEPGKNCPHLHVIMLVVYSYISKCYWSPCFHTFFCIFIPKITFPSLASRLMDDYSKHLVDYNRDLSHKWIFTINYEWINILSWPRQALDLIDLTHSAIYLHSYNH